MNIVLPLPMSAIVASDFNGDGRMDLAITVVTNPVTTAGGVAVLLGKGDGTFQAPATSRREHSRFRSLWVTLMVTGSQT
jgi:hypothetical protein